MRADRALTCNSKMQCSLKTPVQTELESTKAFLVLVCATSCNQSRLQTVPESASHGFRLATQQADFTRDVLRSCKEGTRIQVGRPKSTCNDGIDMALRIRRRPCSSPVGTAAQAHATVCRHTTPADTQQV